MHWQPWSIVPSLFLLFLGLASLVRSYEISGISAGVNSATGARPFRSDINQFARSGAAFDLYILALQQFQQTDQSRLLSFFQISGIHGFPHQPWDGVVGEQSVAGFCAHGCAIFPTWHRPYVALHEQVIWTIAQTIARTYPLSQREEYTDAALTLRVPYWDWVINPSLPEAVVNPTVNVNTPDGPMQVINPLYRYIFLQNQTGNGFPNGNAVWQDIAPLPWTVRSWNGMPDYQSNQSASNAALLAQASSILGMTYQLLTSVTDYAAMCSQNKASPEYIGNNIEAIHNSIHASVGQNGHMAITELAAFDPVFFLHHANVDRILAMWQVLNPDSYLEPTVNNVGTYVEAPGSIDSGNTSLYPFHSDNGTTFYTSDKVRSTRRFGYAYPEIVDWNVSTSDLQSRVRTFVNTMYNPSGTTTRPKSARTQPRHTGLISAFSHISFDMVKTMGVNSLTTQWSVLVEVAHGTQAGRFTIDFFMGPAPAESGSWATAPNLIGSYAQLLGSAMSPKSADASTVLLRGEVSLTHTLAAGVKRGVMEDLTPHCVLPLLADHLEWKARAIDGSEIDLASLTGLSISVVSRELTPATDLSEFPVYGDALWHPTVTQNKQGGARQWHRLEE